MTTNLTGFTATLMQDLAEAAVSSPRRVAWTGTLACPGTTASMGPR